jgi:IS30 family transposase
MHHHLKQSDRACIAALLRSSYSYSAIARVLEVHPSTVSREVKRNNEGIYKVYQAQRYARDRRAQAREAYRKLIG